MKVLTLLQGFATVDGRNPAPVDMVNIPLFTKVLAPFQGGFLAGFLKQPAVNVLHRGNFSRLNGCTQKFMEVNGESIR